MNGNCKVKTQFNQTHYTIKVFSFIVTFYSVTMDGHTGMLNSLVHKLFNISSYKVCSLYVFCHYAWSSLRLLTKQCNIEVLVSIQY